MVLAIFGNLIGQLATAQWFPHAKIGGTAPGYFSTGLVNIGLPQIIGIACIVVVWILNIFGVKPSKWAGRVTGLLLIIPVGTFMVAAFFTGHWKSSNVTYVHIPGHSDFSVWMVWLFIMAWSAYGAEITATFAPEFHSTKRDTPLALRTSATFTLLVFALLPLGLGGVTGAHGDSGAFYVAAFHTIIGSGLGSIALIPMLASLFLAMNSSTADGGRALYGIAKADMTLKGARPPEQIPRALARDDSWTCS